MLHVPRRQSLVPVPQVMSHVVPAPVQLGVQFEAVRLEEIAQREPGFVHGVGHVFPLLRERILGTDRFEVKCICSPD